jgi:hypothetical protein
LRLDYYVVVIQVVWWQLDYAFSHEKRIIPVVCQPIEYSDTKSSICALNWIFFIDENKQEGFESVQTITAAERKKDPYAFPMTLLERFIDLDNAHTRKHTKLLRRTLKWMKLDWEKSLLLRGSDLALAQTWLSACALGKVPRPTRFHLAYIAASANFENNRRKRQLVAVSIGIILIIGNIWASWGVFFFALVFSHCFVYFSSRGEEAPENSLRNTSRVSRNAGARRANQKQRDSSD